MVAMVTYVGKGEPALAVNRLLNLEVPLLVLWSPHLGREPGNAWCRPASSDQLGYCQTIGQGRNPQRGVSVANGVCSRVNGRLGARRIAPMYGGGPSRLRREQGDRNQVGQIHERVSDKCREGIIENPEPAA